MKTFKKYFPILLFAVFFITSISIIAEENPVEQSDQAITKEVQQKIHGNLFYTVYDWVTVKTHNGVVTLDGYVHQPWDQTFFVEIVKKIDGVKSVKDYLQKVNGSDELLYQIARTIYNSPEFEKYAYFKDPPIHIIVIGNKVILKGNVSTNTLKSWADLQVRWHTSVSDIQNDLTVEKG